jgi:hypothetical protein
MVTIGIDAHKRSHTDVAIDEQGRRLAERFGGTRSAEHLALVAWALASQSVAGRLRTAGTSRAVWSETCSPPASGSCACRRS